VHFNPAIGRHRSCIDPPTIAFGASLSRLPVTVKDDSRCVTSPDYSLSASAGALDTMPHMVQPADPDWLPDPSGRFDSRYWDGERWTRAVMRDGEVDTDAEDPTFLDATQPSVAQREMPRPETDLSPVACAVRLTSLTPEEAQARLSRLLIASAISPSEDSRRLSRSKGNPTGCSSSRCASSGFYPASSTGM
jgi:Protein of unknown function (DUF2510)